MSTTEDLFERMQAIAARSGVEFDAACTRSLRHMIAEAHRLVIQTPMKAREINANALRLTDAMVQHARLHNVRILSHRELDGACQELGKAWPFCDDRGPASR